MYSSQLLCFLITHITVFEFFVPKGETKGGSASTLYSNEKKERGKEGKRERRRGKDESRAEEEKLGTEVI